MNSNIPRYAIWRPGMSWDKVTSRTPTLDTQATAGVLNHEARLRDMDAME